MEIDFRRLVALLKREAEICRAWVAALERLAAASAAADPEGVSSLVGEMSRLQQRMREAEGLRGEWIAGLAASLGCSAAEITLRRVVHLAPPVEGRVLSDLREEISGLLQRLRDLQGRASLDCRRAADLAQTLFDAARGLSAGGVRYGSEGRLEEGRRGGALVSRDA